MECCGNCKYHMPQRKAGKLCGFTCDNENSDCYGLETEYKDSCMDFEERE